MPTAFNFSFKEIKTQKKVFNYVLLSLMHAFWKEHFYGDDDQIMISEAGDDVPSVLWESPSVRKRKKAIIINWIQQSVLRED